MSRKIRTCPVCGGTDKKFLYRNAMAAIGGIDLSNIIVECSRCHSVFADDLASKEEYEKYYSLYSKYDTGENPSQATCTIHEKIVDIVSQFFHESIYGVADIGCGSGYLLEVFRKRFQNINLFGIDPSPETARARLQSFQNVTVCQGFIKDAGLVDKICNVFCLTAVLEHLENPYSDLLMLSEILSEKDCLVIEVPNVASFDGQDGEPYGEFSLEHINYFSLDSITNLLMRAGFSVVAAENLDSENCGSIIVLCQKNKSLYPVKISDNSKLKKYIESSEIHWKKSVEEKLKNISEKFFIFGAGSHTAKMMGRYGGFFSKFCMGIVDNNKNLHNATIGDFTILPPCELPSDQEINVLISSFKAESMLAQEIRSIRPFAKIMTLYS